MVGFSNGVKLATGGSGTNKANMSNISQQNVMDTSQPSFRSLGKKVKSEQADGLPANSSLVLRLSSQILISLGGFSILSCWSETKLNLQYI